MNTQMLIDLIQELLIWIQDDESCEYVIILKGKEIRLFKEVKEIK